MAEPPRNSSSVLSTRGAIRAFHLFPRLPTELRLKIWDMALPPPRIVPIKCGSASISISNVRQRSYSRSPSSSPPCPSPSSQGCTSPATIPSILHVCRESRSEALRSYRLMFGIGRQPGRIFFAPDRDILYFGPRDGYMASDSQFRTVLMLARPKELAAVRYLALNEALFYVDGMSSESVLTDDNFERFINGTYSPPSDRIETRVQREEFYHSTVAASLISSALGMMRERLTGLEELIFVPRDDNPVYSAGAVLVEPPVPQLRLRRQIMMAMRPEYSFIECRDGVVVEEPPFLPLCRILSMASEPTGEWYGGGCATADAPEEVLKWDVALNSRCWEAEDEWEDYD